MLFLSLCIIFPSIVPGRGTKGGGGGGGGGPVLEDCKELELSQEEALEKAADVLPEDVLTGLTDVNWKVRLSSVESFTEVRVNVPWCCVSSGKIIFVVIY